MSFDMLDDAATEFLIQHANCSIENHDPETCGAAK